ncbi:nucleoside phosphorylase [Bacteroidales bacterium OttesenSCG-928-I21]|nr:nucleoside phosphorylase [Bacteroidales bacterium OttesenSCG-928-I21]
MKPIGNSELIINNDGSVFHLHLLPEQLAENVILVGDQNRVPIVASFFDKKEYETNNREFKSITGTYKNKPITVLSTGIGTDNVDIVINELDALVNVDFKTRMINPKLKQLNIVRVGTSGGLQPECDLGSFVVSEKSIGFDGLLNFYADRDKVSDLDFEKEFVRQVIWADSHPAPYVVSADKELVNRIAKDDMIRGVTISANGFYGPQGREVRLKLADPRLNEKIENFRYNNYKITNFEMESSAVAGLSRMLGHKAMTVCVIIANRLAKSANVNYQRSIENLIETVLERI